MTIPRPLRGRLSRICTTRTWLGALPVALADAVSYSLAVLVASLVADLFTDWVAPGPFTLVLAAGLIASVPLRRRILVPVCAWTTGTGVGVDEGRGLLSRLRRGPGSDWWRHQTSVLLVTVGLWATFWTVAAAGWTLESYLAYTGAGGEPTHPTGVLVAFALLGLLAGVVATALGEIAGVEAGVRTMLGTVRTRPRSVLARSLAVGLPAVLTGVAVVITIVETSSSPGLDSPSLAAVLSVALLVGVVARAAAIAMRSPGESPAGTPNVTGSVSCTPVSWGRVAVAVLVVSSLLVGTAAVRVADSGFEPVDEPAALAGGPAATYETAMANTMGQSHRTVVESESRDGDDSDTNAIRSTYALDYDDRQYLVSLGGGRQAGFFGEGMNARKIENAEFTYADDPVARLLIGFLGWIGDEWAADATHPGAFSVEQSMMATPDGYAPTADGPWRVVEQNESIVVLGIDGRAVGGAVRNLPDRNAESFTLARNASARAVVDRDARSLEALRVEATVFEWVDGDRRFYRGISIHYRFEKVGTFDLERPADVGPRRPVEWLWDYVYY